MQEKVKSINFEEKVKDLTANLNRLQQELTNAHRVVEPLKVQIRELQQLIADNLTNEQLQAYAKKQQLLLFTGD
jgi:phage shock protein A